VGAILAEIETRLPDGVSYEETGRAEPLEFVSDAERLGGPPGPAVPFNTDAHTLAPLGAELILMGPGDMRCAHADGERLSIEALRAGIQAYAELVVRLR
jgi:acetylornithine deacetylase